MTETYALKATIRKIAGDATLQAQSVLRPPHMAGEGDLVGLSQEFYHTSKDAIPLRRETQLWSMKDGRFMPRRLASVDAALQPRAGLAFGLLAEDKIAQGLSLQAAMDWPDFDCPTHIAALFVSGGAIVFLRRQDLGLAQRAGREAQSHLEATQRVFLPDHLSNHAKLEALSSLSAAASDLATFGTFERYLANGGQMTPSIRNVEVTL